MHHFRSPTLAALIVPIFAIASSPLLSAADGDTSSVDAHLKALDQEIQDLKRQLGAAKGTAPVPTPAPEGVQAPLAVVRANSKDGFLIQSADGSNKLRIGGYLDFDYRVFANDERAISLWGTPAANTFYMRHARPELTGTVADIFVFRFLAEFAPTQSANTSGYTQAPVLLDAYVATRIDPGFVITVGQFKSPIGLEYLQYTPYNEFVEIGLASQLVPGRDEGVQFSGKVAGGTLFYQVGLFNGGIDGAANIYNDVNSGKDAEGRIILTPFARSNIEWLADLNIGISGSFGRENGTGAPPAPAAAVTTTGLPSFKTTSQLTFFTYNQTAFANGEHIRYSPQAYWSIGSLWTLDEYVVSKQRVGGFGAIDSFVTNKAYQVEVGYVLTGEKASYNGVTPASDVNKGGWGAWELVARVNHLAIGEEAFAHGAAGDANITKSAREATALAVGANWYLNRNIKFQLDYEHTEFKGGGGGTVAAPVDRNNENLIVSRLQLLY